MDVEYYTWIGYIDRGEFVVNLLLSLFNHLERRKWGKGGYRGIVIFANYDHHLIRLHENLVKYPSN